MQAASAPVKLLDMTLGGGLSYLAAFFLIHTVNEPTLRSSIFPAVGLCSRLKETTRTEPCRPSLPSHSSCASWLDCAS